MDLRALGALFKAKHKANFLFWWSLSNCIRTDTHTDTHTHTKHSNAKPHTQCRGSRHLPEGDRSGFCTYLDCVVVAGFIVRILLPCRRNRSIRKSTGRFKLHIQNVINRKRVLNSRLVDLIDLIDSINA